MQSHGRVQAGWYRWQLPAELGLHSQMEDDRELLPARIHLPHHLCWEGDQLHTKPKAWQLGLIPSVAPKQLHPNSRRRGSAQPQTKPRWEPSTWSWVLWKFPALWRSAVNDIGLCMNLKAQSFAPKPLQTKPSVLGLAAAAGCRRLPICAGGEAISTDSLLHHLLLLAETSTSRLRGPWQNRALAVRGRG